MYRTYGKNEYDLQVAEELLSYTYKESSDELLIAYYCNGLNLEDVSQFEKACANQKKEYHKFIKKFLDEETRTQFVAVYFNENRIVSALRMIEISDQNWFLEALETTPSERQKGFGKLLVKKLVEDINMRNGKSIIAHIHKSNQESIKLHESCGFRVTNNLVHDEDGHYYKNHLEFIYKVLA